MTIRDALNMAKARLSPVTASAALDSQILLCAILEKDRAWLLSHPEALIDTAQMEKFEAWVDRAALGEPIPYILGRRAFYDRDFIVSPAVLIPRPETELLLEQALDYVGDRALVAADIGTGSGALAVTLAARRPKMTVYATDRSPAALKVARQNAEAHGVKVALLEGDLAQPIIERGIRCDLIMANLPYIPSELVDTLKVSEHEPRLALDGGDDGLDFVRRLLEQIPQFAAARTLILLEIMAGQGNAARDSVHKSLPDAAVQVISDYAGHDRIVRITYERNLSG